MWKIRDGYFVILKIHKDIKMLMEFMILEAHKHFYSHIFNYYLIYRVSQQNKIYMQMISML